MRKTSVFQEIVLPSLEQVPLLEVLHIERHGGREFIVSHIIKRNIFTAFDARLSRHLAATSGEGYAAISVEARLRERDEPHAWHPLRPSDHASLPHALAAVARRALGEATSVTLRLHFQGFRDARTRGAGIKRVITTEDVHVLDQALAACRQFGEPAFLDISGDFDLIAVQPVDHALPPVFMDLHDRRITFPTMEGVSTGPVSAPLYDVEKVMAETASVRAYLANLRHRLITQKEAAVLAFRAAAEERILEFDRALAGRDLVFHRLDAVISLVSRLKAGLGDSLKGISEDARLRALDWAEAIEDSFVPHRGAATATAWPQVTMAGATSATRGSAAAAG